MYPFNVRVYGILIDSSKRVLVADEFIRGYFVTKFPGGGLEYGEGTRDCLKREFLEETGLDVTIGEHIYTTDFYQQSAFNPNDQIISIYYQVNTAESGSLQTQITHFNFEPAAISNPQGEAEVFRWIDWNDFNCDNLTLPIDKLVANILKKKI